ncbi:MAG: bifunctional 3,4-dihydroxy-2-butanone-4-phosphate synthase/GTP cyclohydrolase II [Planctomycetes bacterium]|nr:bifunctional 3,4-dihydroxy-2-butanone-4-phosphate synthase/GTP cyclohydrolase II [Planctomycetota bacterium]
MNHFISVKNALKELKKGRMIILVDDEERENEGDIVCAADFITPDKINFMAKHARGLICLALNQQICKKLNLQLMVSDHNNNTKFGTAFTVSIDSAKGVSTGISAADRANTILTAINDNAKSEDLVRPGHVFPLMYREGGVLIRSGHTEGAVDMCILSRLKPAAVICEIMKDNGEMARLPDLIEMSKTFDLPIVSIKDIIEYRRKNEKLIEKVTVVKLPTEYGLFNAHLYRSIIEDTLHLVLTSGRVGKSQEINEPVLVRMHSECITGDVFESKRCDCGEQLDMAMKLIGKEGEGAFHYIKNQEGRGIGLVNKLKAYALQEKGFDTVEANLQLGLPVDLRHYGIGAQILYDLGIRKIRLLTNNPKKIYGLRGFGLEIVEQIPIRVKPNKFNRKYLVTKQKKLGHLLQVT